MEVINRFDNMDGSGNENIISDETVRVVLEEAEIVDCEADVEVEDDNIQYHLYAVNRGDNTVAYKVMQVGDNNHRQNEVSIATPINNAVQVLASPLNGQFYIFNNSSDTVTSEPPRTILPHVAKLQAEKTEKIIAGMKKRDERRRVTHNEVERRRRDKINSWITKLGKLLPDCDQNTNGDGDAKANFESQSKGGILERACEYISQLRETQKKLVQSLEENVQLTEEAKNLQQVVNDLRNENSKLKTQVAKDNTFILDS